MFEIHESCIKAAEALDNYLMTKLGGSVRLGEKCGQPILFSINKMQDAGKVRAVKPLRFAELGFCKGMEQRLWADYRERHNRQSYLIGQDEQDYSRQLIDSFDDVRVGDFSNINAAPVNDEEPFYTDSFGFKNEALTTDEELIKTFAGAQQSHIEKIKKRIADSKAARTTIEKGKNKGRMTGSICATKMNSADFNYEEETFNLRAELELVYRKLDVSSAEDGQEPEDWLDAAWEQFEALRVKAWTRYGSEHRLYDKHAAKIGGEMEPAMLHFIKGEMLECVLNAENAKKNALRYDGILSVIEREMQEIARGGLEDQTHEFGAMFKDVYDRFEHQFATREGGLRDIDDRVLAKHYAPTPESAYIAQHLGYGIEDFAEQF